MSISSISTHGRHSPAAHHPISHAAGIAQAGRKNVGDGDKDAGPARTNPPAPDGAGKRLNVSA